MGIGRLLHDVYVIICVTTTLDARLSCWGPPIKISYYTGTATGDGKVALTRHAAVKKESGREPFGRC